MKTKKLIRNNVFETNSSSCHSITLSETHGMLETIVPDTNGVISLTGGEFGWGIEEFTDSITKANYVAVDFHGNKDLTNKLIKILKEQTGCTSVEFNFSTEGYHNENYSYIDHESVGTARELSEEDIRNFIFDPNSVLLIDNDNHD